MSSRLTSAATLVVLTVAIILAARMVPVAWLG
jgi:hypothetical protein